MVSDGKENEDDDDERLDYPRDNDRTYLFY
jgi:hypothetical protein